MKISTAICVLLAAFVSVSMAQIDLLEINSFGTIGNFSEEASLRSWSSVDCNGGQTFEMIADPDNGANTVGLFTSTACTDEGFVLDQAFMAFDFSLHHFISLDVYAPAANKPIVVKVFNSADPNQFKTVEMMTQKAAEWDTLNFEFAGTPAGLYDRLSIHPAFGETTAGEEWMIDNIRKDRGFIYPRNSDGMLIDFDTIRPYMHMWDCGVITAAEFLIVENPDTSGINKSASCGLYFTSDCTWEGAAMAEKMAPINVDEAYIVSIKVLAPAAGMNFMFKVERWENSSDMVETPVLTTVGGEWEEMFFDLSAIQSEYYTKIALFPDFSSAEENGDWYFDEVKLINPNDTYVDPDKVVKVLQLSSKNYPNPYNPSTTIAYHMPMTSDVKVTVYDVNGREIQTLVNARQEAGQHSVVFDAASLSSGIYLYKVKTSYDEVVNKMVLVR